MDSLSKKPIPAPIREKPAERLYPPPQRRPVTAAPSEARPKTPKTRGLFFSRPLFWRRLGFLILLCAIAWGGYFAWKIYSVSRAIRMVSSQEQSSSTDQSSSTLSGMRAIASTILTDTAEPLKNDSQGRANILLLGRAGEHHPGHDLTDTVMIMSIDTKTGKIALLSLPRDLYVQIPETKTFTKINAVYQEGLSQNKGIDLIKDTVENITGISIQYSFVIDFDGFEHVIDALGGVNVEVMRDIYDSRYPGPNYSYETFEIHKGWQILDGKTALKYVRERHDDPEGDFGRAKRQQQVIQAVKSKAFSIKTFVDAFALNKLLTVLGDSVKTTITPDDLPSFIAQSKRVDTENITNVVIDAWKPDSLLRVSHIMIGPTRMFILVPRTGNYGEIRDIAEHIFDLDALRRRQDAITQENARILIVNRSSNPRIASRVKTLLRDSLGIESSEIAIRSAGQDTADVTPTQTESFVTRVSSISKPFTLDEILKKLPITLKQEASDFQETALSETDDTDQAPYDFIITLGDTIARDLDFEEDSVDDFKKSEENDIAYPSEMTP